MFTDHDLQELLHFQASQPVLSVYLNTDPAQGNADYHKRQLRSMLKDIGLEDDVEAVLRYLDHSHDWGGHSLAIFSCSPQGFFKAFSLAVPLRSRVRVSDRPHVKPLADLLDSYGGYGVALVDKQGARFFHFHLGELQEQEGVMGETVRHTKRGGGSQAPGRRGGSAGQTDYVEEVAERNIKEAVEYATRFFAEKNVRRVLIGGTEDNVALFRSQLPKAWQSLVIGSFPVSMVASHTEVLEKSLAVGQQVEKQREVALAQAIVTAAAKGRGGVVGLGDTLQSVHDGRVQTLMIRDGYRAQGFQCNQCGNISVDAIETCPFCGGPTVRIPDVVDLAVRRVMQSGGEVEVLQADQPTKGFDQIGALLRY